MNGVLLRLLPLLIFLVLAFVTALGLFTPRAIRELPSPMIGRPLPAIVLPMMGQQGKVFLITQWKDKVAVVNIFASYCVPCRAEHKFLEDLSRRPGFNLYGIAWKDTEAAVSTFLSEVGNPFRSVGIDQLGQITLTFGMTGLPETYIIDKSGKVRWKFAGPLTAEDVNSKLIPLVMQLNNEP